MADALQEGTASLEPGWEKLPTESLRDLRTVLGTRWMVMLRRNKLKECENVQGLLTKVRAELARRK